MKIQVLGDWQKTKKVVEQANNGNTNYNWHAWNNLHWLEMSVEELEIEQIKTILTTALLKYF